MDDHFKIVFCFFRTFFFLSTFNTGTLQMYTHKYELFHIWNPHGIENFTTKALNKLLFAHIRFHRVQFIYLFFLNIYIDK